MVYMSTTQVNRQPNEKIETEAGSAPSKPTPQAEPTVASFFCIESSLRWHVAR